MGKVLKMPIEKTKEEWIQDALEAMNNGEKLAVIASNPDGTILTGYWNCDCSDKQVMIGHMQIDVMLDVIEVNYE